MFNIEVERSKWKNHIEFMRHFLLVSWVGIVGLVGKGCLQYFSGGRKHIIRTTDRIREQAIKGEIKL